VYVNEQRAIYRYIVHSSPYEDIASLLPSRWFVDVLMTHMFITL